MPRQYSMGGRVSQGSAAGGPGGPAQAPTPRSLRERFGALRNLPPFLKLIWDISPTLTIASGSLRLIRALLPVITLYVGKLIIDEVIALAGNGAVHVGWRNGWRAASSTRCGCCLRSSSGWP